jgi:hypothetical protein
VNSIASSVPLRPGPPCPIYDMGLGGSPARAQHANLRMNGLSLGHNQPQQQPGSTDTMEKVMATVQTIQEEIAIIKEQMDDTVIDVAGQRFNTKKELGAWLLINTKLTEEEMVKGKMDILILFTDAMGMFGLIWQESGEGRDMTYKVQSKKAGYASTDDAIFMSSFEGSLPKLFGTTRTDTRTLPKAKDHTMLDSGIQNTSFKSKLEKSVLQHSKLLKEQANACLSSEGAAVAHECIVSAQSFITTLLNWMTITHISMKHEHGARTESDNWLFISHLVNAIFKSLAEERNEGYGARTVHGIIWACLKARKVQSEIQLKGVGGHNIVTNVLNQHLQASAVMKSEYEKGMLDMTKQMKSLRKEMEAVSRKANQAVMASQRK